MHHAIGISTASGDYPGTRQQRHRRDHSRIPAQPGMSRDDLLKANYDVVKAVRRTNRQTFAERASLS